MMEWKKVKISSVATIISGSTPKGIDSYNRATGEVPFYRVSDMNLIGNEKWMDSSHISVDKKDAIRLKLKICKQGTVIFPKRGGAIFTNKKRILSRDSAFDLNTMGVYPREGLDNNYFFYWFNSINLGTLADGSSVPQLNNKHIVSLKIPLPPLPEQKRIAHILDQADQVQQLNQQLLEQYDALTQSLFLDMFGDPVRNPMGWEKVKMKDICTKITDGTHHSPEPQTEGYPYVTAKHVKSYGLDFELKPSFVSKEAHDEIYKRCTPEFGDLLYIKDGATTGIACINTFKEPISLLSSLALLKLDENKINNFYLVNWLNHEGVKQQLISKFMSGAAIKRYTLKKINYFTVILPPLNLQNQFAQRIQQIEAQKAQAQAALAASQDLFNSLLQKAFKGELS